MPIACQMPLRLGLPAIRAGRAAAPRPCPAGAAGAAAPRPCPAGAGAAGAAPRAWPTSGMTASDTAAASPTATIAPVNRIRICRISCKEPVVRPVTIAEFLAPDTTSLDACQGVRRPAASARTSAASAVGQRPHFTHSRQPGARHEAAVGARLQVRGVHVGQHAPDPLRDDLHRLYLVGSDVHDADQHVLAGSAASTATSTPDAAVSTETWSTDDLASSGSVTP